MEDRIEWAMSANGSRFASCVRMPCSRRKCRFVKERVASRKHPWASHGVSGRHEVEARELVTGRKRCAMVGCFHGQRAAKEGFATKIGLDGMWTESVKIDQESFKNIECAFEVKIPNACFRKRLRFSMDYST